MKLKGVGFFEQHVEKIVLAAVSAVFLGVVAMQFLYEPNKIKVGNEPPLPPGLAFEPVKKKAEMVQSKMTASAETLNLPAVPKVNLVDQFIKRHADPVAPMDRIVGLGKGVEIEGIAGPDRGPTGTQRLIALQVPATSTPVACSYHNTFDPTEPISTPELKKLLPEAQPLDKASVSVEAAFDGTAFKSALLGTAKTEENASSYPANWWRGDQVELLGVKLERQEQTTDGQWGEAQEVATAPGRGIPDLLKNVKAQTDIPDLLGTARGAADDLLRPSFYRVIAGPQWKKPSEAVKGGDVGKAAETKKLVDQRSALLKEQDGFKKQLEKLGAPKPPPGGGGGGGGGGKTGGGAQQPPREGIRDPKEDPRFKQLQDRLKKTEENLTKNESDLRVLGFDADGNPLPAEAVVANNPANAEAPKSLLDNPAVPVWAHDLTVTPGKTYRYRVKVIANNPAFGRGAGLIAEQQDLGKSPVVESAPSEWSEPVAVLADKYYYIVSATEADPQGPARARAELYQFFYGYYRSCQVYLEPGDVLAGPVRLPDASKLPIYDLTKLAAAEPGQPAVQPQQPDRNPGIPTKLGPGPGRGGMQVNEGGDRRQAAAPGQDKAAVILPDNAKPWSGPVRVEFDTFMLDVAKIPGAIGGAKVHTFLRGPNGATIVTRATAEDEKEDTYRILTASSKDGENQGQPVAPVAPVKKPDGPGPNQPGPNRPPPPPPPGGGGGGGGGGG